MFLHGVGSSISNCNGWIQPPIWFSTGVHQPVCNACVMLYVTQISVCDAQFVHPQFSTPEHTG